MTTQSAPQTAAAQLQWLVDRAAITDHMLRYARCVDGRDWEGWAACFTPDGVFELDGAQVLQSEMAEWLGTMLQFYPATQHIMTNFVIEIDGDRAATRHYLHSSHLPDRARPLRHSDVGGWYDSEYRRTDEGWRFTRVRLEFLWEDGEAFVPGREGPPPEQHT
jgi:hypothetical protein